MNFKMDRTSRKSFQGSCRVFLVTSGVALLILCLSATTVASGDAMSKFTLLVEQDSGLSAAEKEQWTSTTMEAFRDKEFTFDYSRLIYGILSQGKFDEVTMDKTIQVALHSTMAMEQGAPEEEVGELALFAFSTNLLPEEIRLYAVTTKKCSAAGVPVYVTREMIRHAKEELWPENTFTTIMNGLTESARRNMATEKIALFMLISVAQKLGTPEQIVRDALEDARQRKSAPLQKERTIPTTPTPAVTPAPLTPRVALNFDAFRQSVESFLGTPYRWGGNSRMGVDCSGFTSLVMYENGYRVPRVSGNQARVGTPVYKNQLQLGDLVFFDTKGSGRITHVGFYLGGNLMAHASSSKGVTIVFFSNRYFQSRYVTARRIIRYVNR